MKKCVSCLDKVYRGNTCEKHHKVLMKHTIVINQAQTSEIHEFAIDQTEEDKRRQLLAQTWQAENLDY